MLRADKFDYTTYVQAALKGDQEAFNKLYYHSLNIVKHTCWRYSDNTYDLNDLVQVTYTTMYTNLHTLRDPDKFMGWLKVVAENCCKNEVVKQNHRAPGTPIAEVFDSAEKEDQYIGLSQDHDSVDVILDKAVLNQLMEGLNNRERNIILLFCNGYREREIAETLGIPIGTVKSSKHNALKKMEKAAKKLERKDKINMHGFAFPVYFENAILLKQIYQSLGWLPVSAQDNLCNQTFLAEQYTKSDSNFHKFAKGNGYSRRTIGKTILAAVISLSVITGIILGTIAVQPFKAATLVEHYEKGSTQIYKQQFNKKTGVLTVEDDEIIALANLIDWKNFDKNGVLMSLLEEPVVDYGRYGNTTSLGVTYAFLDRGLFYNFPYAIFAYSPWIKNGKIKQIIAKDDSELIYNCKFYEKNHMLQSCKISGYDNKPYFVHYYYNKNNDLIRITSTDHSKNEETNVVIDYQNNGRVKAVKIYRNPYSGYLGINNIIPRSVPQYNKNGQIEKVTINKNYILIFHYDNKHLESMSDSLGRDGYYLSSISFSHNRISSLQSIGTDPVDLNSSLNSSDDEFIFPDKKMCTFVWKYE